MNTTQTQAVLHMPAAHHARSVRLRTLLIGVTAFLTLVDLFAAQAILPLGQLFERFGWAACVGGIAAALALAGVLASRLQLPSRTAS